MFFNGTPVQKLQFSIETGREEMKTVVSEKLEFED